MSRLRSCSSLLGRGSVHAVTKSTKPVPNRSRPSLPWTMRSIVPVVPDTCILTFNRQLCSNSAKLVFHPHTSGMPTSARLAIRIGSIPIAGKDRVRDGC